MEAALQSKASWDWVPEDTLKAKTPNTLLNSLLPPPLEVSWIGNGSSFLVLTDNNQQSVFCHTSFSCQYVNSVPQCKDAAGPLHSACDILYECLLHTLSKGGS